MKIRHEENIVFTNTSNQSQFKIAATAKAFRILSDGLYSDKISAIIRELSCNAYDSHVMAGCPEKPFNIHLPNEWEPFFSVEDFGIGLSDVEVEEIYTSYFTSTKTDSNDVIGALGLGSKTPFSYTDTFTIQTRKDGIERVYNAFISQTGEPAISKMTESETSEANGVSITVPVKNNDFWSFRTKASSIYKYFKVLPEISGASITVDNSIVEELEEHGRVSTTPGSNYIIAVMGNVGYTVSNFIQTFEKDLDVRQKSYFTYKSMAIKFDIGELDVAASRETISFDEATKENFFAKLNKSIEEEYAHIQDYLDGSECDSIIKAVKYVEKQVGIWGWNLFEYKGASLYDLSNYSSDTLIFDIINESTASYRNKHATFFKYLRQSGGPIRRRVVDCYTNEYKFKNIGQNKILFMINDTDRTHGLDSNIKSLMIEDNFHVAYSFDRNQISEKKKKALQEEFGKDDVIFHTLSAVKDRFKVVREKIKKEKPITPRKVSQRAKKNEIRINYFLKGEQSYSTNTRLLDVNDLSNKNVAVVEFNRGKTSHICGEIYSSEQFGSLVNMLNIDVLILVRESNLEFVLEKIPSAIKLSSIKNIDKMIDSNYLIRSMVMSSANFYYKSKTESLSNLIENFIENDYNYQDRCDVEFNRKLIPYCKELNKYFQYTFDTIDEIFDNGIIDQNFVPPRSSAYKFFQQFKMTIKDVYKKEIKVLTAKYPMIQYLGSNIPSVLLNEYIEMMDKKEKALLEEDFEVEYYRVA